MKTGSKNDSKCVFPSMKFLKLFRFLVRSPLINFMRTCSFFFFCGRRFRTSGRTLSLRKAPAKRVKMGSCSAVSPFSLPLSLPVCRSFFLSLFFLLAFCHSGPALSRPAAYKNGRGRSTSAPSPFQFDMKSVSVRPKKINFDFF